MKIQKLKLFNIASLKGHHEIDFSSISESSNLFAITGKTGAGKSTILNCLSLALYGEVYKKGASATDFITLGEAYGEIELEFFINNQVYSCSWMLKTRKKNGEELKKPQLSRSLFKVNSNEKIAINKNIEEITHLSFNQFCKTTILNQGEFSKFLTSSFTERKDILQKFYDGENLDLLSIHLRNKIKSTTVSQNEKENRILGIADSGADINISEKDLDLIQQENKSLEDLKASGKSLLYYLKDLNDSNKTLLTNQLRKKESETKINVIMSKYNDDKFFLQELQKSLQLSQRTFEEKKPILNEAIRKEIRLKDLKNRLTQIEHKIQQLNVQEKEINQELKSLRQLKESLQKEKETLIKDLPNIEDLIKLPVASDYSQFKLLQMDLSHIEQNKTTYSAQLEEKNSSLNDLSIEFNHLVKHFKPDVAEKYSESIKSGQNHINELNLLISNLQETLSSKHATNAEKEELQTKVKTNDKSFKEIELKLTDVNNQINDIHRIRQLSHLNNALQLCIKESIDSQHCFVCGNEDITHLNVGSTNELNTFEIADEQRLEGLLTKKEEYIESLNLLKVNILTFKKQSSQYEDKISKLNSSSLIKWNFLEYLPPCKNALTNEAIVTAKKVLAEKLQNVQVWNQSQSEYLINLEKKKNFKIHIDQIELDINELQNKIAKAQNLSETIDLQIIELISSYKLKDFNKEAIKTFELIFQHNNSFNKITNKEKLVLLDLKNGQEKLVISSREVTQLQLEQGEKNSQSKMILDFIKQSTISNDPTNELLALETTYKGSEAEFTKHKDSLKQTEIQLAEIRSKIENLNEQITSSNLLNNTTLAELKMIINTMSFYKNDNLSDLETIQKICNKIIQIDLEKTHNDVLHQSYIEFSECMINLEKNLSINLSKASEYKTLLQRKKENLDKIDKLKVELSLIKSSALELDELNSLIGKDEFRNYVLAIIEGLLIEQTNKELKLLCQGRYGILQTNRKNKMASEFKIVDYFHDGLERKVSTLSGGETFLVSLAMAMALAELTRGSTQIDSLFIDEGFGTLDIDSIHEVYELLMEIQHSGKQIGIISHVAALTERIPVNINLVKNTSGLSDISISLN